MCEAKKNQFKAICKKSLELLGIPPTISLTWPNTNLIPRQDRLHYNAIEAFCWETSSQLWRCDVTCELFPLQSKVPSLTAKELG